jgi:Flp pilus assembly protein TadD
MGTAHLQRRQFDKAEEFFTTALRMGTENGVAHLNLGQLYVLWGRYELAIEHFEDALSFMPENPTALNNHAVALIRLGRYEDARKSLMKLIALRPQHPAPYFNVAMSYTLEQQPEQALEWIRRGAGLATPADCQRYLSDSDFSSLRGLPEFQALIRGLYPDLPQGPGGS